ncbi:F-box protein At5g03970-like [Macadamia integrifolia]|uniref:F-box protein At5g03970-like n=1 Tax=Macadamia integrifolia TaxID=60698 RepID=UPI001C5333B4|nr:F-box protein At5g03970-like [Macadamia integrifolia]
MSSSSSSSDSPFSDDILMEILICLPLKSVIRCKCISKRWNHLISQPCFRICYYDRIRRSSIRHLPLGFFQTPSFEILPGAKIPLLKFSATPPSPQAKEEEETEGVDTKSLESSQQILNLLGNIICSSNGLFLCSHNNPRRTHYIFNPLTKECYRLPPLPRKQRQSIMGFVVDSTSLLSSSIRYKVVSADIGTDSHGHTIGMETFSSETCKWRQSTVSIIGSYRPFCWYTSTSSTIGGGIHWMDYEFNNIGVYHPFKEDDELEMIKPPHSLSFIPCLLGESTDGLLQLAAFDYFGTFIKVWIFYSNKEKENQHWSMIHEVKVNSIQRNFDSQFNIPYLIPLAFHPHNPEALFVACSGYIFLFHLNATTTPSLEKVQYIHNYCGSNDGYYGEIVAQFRLHPYFLPLWPISPHPPTVTKNKGPSIITQLQYIFRSYASSYYR